MAVFVAFLLMGMVLLSVQMSSLSKRVRKLEKAQTTTAGAGAPITRSVPVEKQPILDVEPLPSKVAPIAADPVPRPETEPPQTAAAVVGVGAPITRSVPVEKQPILDVEPLPSEVAPIPADPVPRPETEPRQAAAKPFVSLSQRPSFDVLDRLSQSVKTWATTGNVPVKVGVLLTLIGLGFLLGVALEQGWVTLTIGVRLILVGLFGVLLLVLGWRLRHRNAVYGLSLTGGGIAVLYLTTFVAHAVYDLLPASFAAVSVVVVTVGAGVLAVRLDSRSLAVLGITGGFLAPILAYSDAKDHVLVFGFYVILSAAIVAMAWYKTWPELNLLGLGFTVGLTAFWLLTRYEVEGWATTQPLVALLILLYMALPLVMAIRRPPDIKDLMTSPMVLGVPFTGLGFQFLLTDHFEYGTAISAASLAAILGMFAVVAHRFGKASRVLVEIYSGLAMTFLAIAVPLVFDAQYISIVWALQGAMLVWVGLRNDRFLFVVGGGFLQILSAGVFLTYFFETLPLTDFFEYRTAIGAVSLAVIHGAFAVVVHRFGKAPRVLVEIYSVAAMAFLAIAAPLMFDAQYISVVWALQGAALVWVGLRHNLLALVASSGLLQILSAGVFLTYLFETLPYPNGTPVAINGYFLGAALLAVTGFFTSRIIDRREDLLQGSKEITWFFFFWGIGWWLLGGLAEIASQVPENIRLSASIVFVALSLGGMALAAPLVRWPRLSTAGVLLLPALPLSLILALVFQDHPFQLSGWADWIVVLVVYYSVLRLRESNVPQVVTAMHVTGYWVVAVLLGTEIYWQVDRIADGVWPITAALATVLTLAGATMLARDRLAWPLKAHWRTYLMGCAGSVVLVVVAIVALLNLVSNGEATPLTYLPLLNPLGILTVLVVVIALAWKKLTNSETGHPLEAFASGNWAPGLAIAGFVLLTMTVARTVHHWAGVPFDFESMISSTTFQASLSIVWGLTGLTGMMIGRRLARRVVWVGGASLMGVVVVKLFLFELSNTGTVARVVSFLGVGLLLLIVGYFAPVPPAATTETEQVKTGPGSS